MTPAGLIKDAQDLPALPAAPFVQLRDLLHPRTAETIAARLDFPIGHRGRFAAMRIGLDLDGTLVVYDDVFHRYAVERYGLPGEIPARKIEIRAWMRANAPGESGWIELQRLVYGPCIGEAALAPGAADFVGAARAAGADLVVVSHKTRWSVAEPPVDLHAAARAWLEANGFFDELAFRREDVFFEPSRTDKLARIAVERCGLFVDDLEEVFAEPSFPAGVERWLYAPGGSDDAPPGVRVFADWAELTARVGAAVAG